ncbi:hypothetical protein BCR34DRAFT_554362 [Clohesyomyces aquaticus]|uniref:Uncharacterized protein n=1 Tax=Clohesyomyces aquaticus TaxID=1231657 RepID=A0A1Y2A818_9PLEO|nr:hypothetical protein BCR34DRAFT_554362 [Clohesyomyces aquaticus]
MSSFPLLFTLPPSSRHEIILYESSSKPSLKSLNKLLTSTIASSPNCAEFMAKHKSKDTVESIQEIRVHWSSEGRDRKMWPEYTVVTEENLTAVLEMLRIGVGRDVLEVKVGKAE